MNNRSFAAWGVLLVGLITLTSGCGPSSPTVPAVVASSGVSSSNFVATSTKSQNPVVSVASLSAAKAQAEAFLKLLPDDLKGASAKIAVAFKKQVTGSLTYEDEKKLGYSESDTQKYLKDASTGITKWDLRTLVAAPDGTDFSLRGEAASAQGPVHFAVRLTGSGNEWHVTRFAVAKISSGAVAQSKAAAEQLWVRETALDFLDALIASDPEHLLTMAAMTDAFKKHIPDKFPADAGLGYSKRDVRNWLNEVRTGAIGYEITSHSEEAKGQTFSGQLLGSAKPTAFTLLAVRDASGNWMIDNFVVR